MKIFLPHRFKSTGAIIAPLGFALWILMQFGIITKALTMVWGSPQTPAVRSVFHSVNVIAAIIGFLSFLAGMYFISFSREKIEDEMIQR